MKELIKAARWKTRQKYSQLRCRLGLGYNIWDSGEFRFVARQDDAFSHVLFVGQGHEKVEMQWCRRWIEAGNTDQSIIDCGANIGYFSAVLAQLCSLEKIIAIEGNHETAVVCKENLALLGINNAVVIQAVLAADSVEQFVIPNNPGREPWQQAVKVDGMSEVEYSVTLDEIVNQYGVYPSLVKIDCEGFEPAILKGAENLLTSIRPALMLECNDKALVGVGTNRNELFALLRRYNYRTFHLASFTSHFPLGIECSEEFPSSEFNFAAIPNDEQNMRRWVCSSKDQYDLSIIKK
ncbi:MAG: FkbM family methyltransferase [Anaerolineaceae bacterium]|nr:FkbM family methyltransferase [Anaerolineaceae bacterium]